MSAGRVRSQLGTPYVSLIAVPPHSQHLQPTALQLEIQLSYERKLLERVDCLRHLTTAQIDAIIQAGVRVEVREGVQIVSEGITSKSLMYIVTQGTCKATRRYDFSPEAAPSVIGYYDIGDHFGGAALLQNSPTSLRTVTVTADTPVTVLALSRQSFGDVLEPVLAALSRELEHRRWLLAYRNRVPLPELSKKATIGKGNFGTVWLTSYVPAPSFGDDPSEVPPIVPYAVKSVAKSRVIGSKRTIDGTVSERALLSTLNHPGIPKLVGAYQTPVAVHLIMEYVQGGDLLRLLGERRSLDIEATRFYTANMNSILSYLRGLDVAHRDVKPENIMIDARGYLKLVDFGASKVVEEGRSFTSCGTPEYMAPEVVCAQAHSCEVDVWALGVLVFQMLVGQSPFEASEPREVLRKVVAYSKGEASLPFPWFFNAEAQALISALLTANLDDRLSPHQVQHHVFLKGIEQLKIEARALIAPYMPTLADEFDASCSLNLTYDENATTEASPNAATGSGSFPGFAFCNTEW